MELPNWLTDCCTDKIQQLDKLAIYPMDYICSYCPREVTYACGSNRDGTTMMCSKIEYQECNCRYFKGPTYVL